jgi:SAM-dependent methyltransferase
LARLCWLQRICESGVVTDAFGYKEGITEDRLRREKEFHDARFASAGRSADRFYAIDQASDRFFRERIDAAPAGGRVLDYGCGESAYCALHAARQGHEVTAIDISDVAIDHAREQAARAGVADKIEFRAMNAEALEFDDDSFDLVSGLGIIHHLDVARSMSEVARVLKPGGEAVFVEPLGHNPMINAYRRRTPEQRSVDEHPLRMDDIDALGRWFGTVEATYFHLLGLLALPFMRRRSFKRLVDALDAADRRLFRAVEPARRHAWMVGLRLSDPRN